MPISFCFLAIENNLFLNYRETIVVSSLCLEMCSNTVFRLDTLHKNTVVTDVKNDDKNA